MRWQMACASAVTSLAAKLSMQMTVSADSKKSLLAPLTSTCQDKETVKPLVCIRIELCAWHNDGSASEL